MRSHVMRIYIHGDNMNKNDLNDKDFLKRMELSINADIVNINKIVANKKAIKQIKKALKKTTKALYKNYEQKLEVWKTLVKTNQKEDWKDVQLAIDTYHQYKNALLVIDGIEKELKNNLSIHIDNSINKIKNNIGLNTST